jgi:DNA-binding MarR family transcriptional regulator
MDENKDIKMVMDILKTLFELKNSLIGQVSRQVHRHNINRSEFIALISICDNGKKNMSELCRDVDLKSGSLTSLIDNLIKKGYVKREFDKNDRRKILIVLTASGRNLTKIIKKSLEDSALSKIKKLGPEERKNFSRAIDTLKMITAKLESED